MAKQTRSLAIDLIKGLSVLYIVGFWHLLNYTNAFPSYDNEITRRLTVIVLGLFVFVSGLLIGNKQLKAEGFDLVGYYRSRLIRIYPPYIIAIACFYFFGISDGYTLMKAAGLVSMFAGPPPPTLWFITMIVFFYVISPALVRFGQNTPRLIMVCAIVETVFVLLDVLGSPIDMRISIYFPAFVAGIHFSRQMGVSEAAMGGGKTAAMVLALLVSLGLSLHYPNFPERSYLSIPLAIAGPILIYVFSRRWERLITWRRPVAMLSYSSYFMFLFHRPIYETLRDIYFPDSFAMQVAYLFVICLPMVFAISWALQKTYDLMVRSFDSSFSRK
jgi:peptidoglycan/LPS O-acetylase OafA/YrhL